MPDVRTIFNKVLPFVLLVGLAAGVRADELPRGSPEELGFSSARLEYIDRFYSEKVQRGEMAGIVTLVARHGKIVHFTAVGYADIEKKKKMETDTLFRLYSMTKPIASVALMMLYQEGRFQMNDPIAKYIPEFSNLRVLRTPDAALADTVAMIHPPTIQDAMRHTAGFTHGGASTPLERQYDQEGVFGDAVSLAEMMKKLSKIPLHYQPGTRFQYSIGPDIQARLVEILSGMPFDQFLERRLFSPLKMKDTGFWVKADQAARLATVYWRKEGRPLPVDAAHGHPEGHGPSRGWQDFGHYTINRTQKGGSSGLVSSAEDYWRFAQMLLNGGQLGGARILSPAVVHYMARDQLGTISMDPDGERATGIGFGLGFAVVKDPVQAGFLSSEGTFFWAGAANTHFWIDPKEDLVVVAMTQDMGGAPGEELRGQIRALVYGALIN